LKDDSKVRSVSLAFELEEKVTEDNGSWVV
jgi:hypothetical protein